MRKSIFSIAVVVTLFAGVSQTAAIADQPPSELLLQVVELPRVAHVPLKNVLKLIASQANLRLSYELEAIEHERISLDTPIDANLPSITAGDALTLVLEPLGLKYELAGDRVLIGLKDDPQRVEEISYPIADLLSVPGTSPPTPDDGAKLVDLIKTTIAQPTWGNRHLTIKVDSETKRLVILQTTDVHSQIAALLKQLRRLRQEGAPRESLKTLVNINVQNAPLSKVVGTISEQCHLNILLILTPGIGDPAVSINAKDITGQEALARLLSPLGMKQTIAHEALTVAADNDFVGVVYPVADLLQHGASFASMIERIRADVQPESWSSRGGEASIQAFETNQSLVVTQNQKGHELVKAILEKLRANRYAPVA